MSARRRRGRSRRRRRPKLTLTLRVLGTRPDGFHELEALTVVGVGAGRHGSRDRDGPRRGVALDVDRAPAPTCPTGDDNLVVRAARAVLPAGEGVRVDAHAR